MAMEYGHDVGNSNIESEPRRQQPRMVGFARKAAIALQGGIVLLSLGALVVAIVEARGGSGGLGSIVVLPLSGVTILLGAAGIVGIAKGASWAPWVIAITLVLPDGFEGSGELGIAVKGLTALVVYLAFAGRR
jgi:hypothetical protein